eukprot:g2382.t1
MVGRVGAIAARIPEEGEETGEAIIIHLALRTTIETNNCETETIIGAGARTSIGTIAAVGLQRPRRGPTVSTRRGRPPNFVPGSVRKMEDNYDPKYAQGRPNSLRMLVPESAYKPIIGVKGANVKSIGQQYGVFLNVSDRPFVSQENCTDHIVSISTRLQAAGYVHAIDQCADAMKAVMELAFPSQAGQDPETRVYKVILLMPQRFMGLVVGPGGARVKYMRAAWELGIDTSNADGVPAVGQGSSRGLRSDFTYKQYDGELVLTGRMRNIMEVANLLNDVLQVYYDHVPDNMSGPREKPQKELQQRDQINDKANRLKFEASSGKDVQKTKINREFFDWAKQAPKGPQNCNNSNWKSGGTGGGAGVSGGSRYNLSTVGEDAAAAEPGPEGSKPGSAASAGAGSGAGSGAGASSSTDEGKAKTAGQLPGRGADNSEVVDGVEEIEPSPSSADPDENGKNLDESLPSSTGARPKKMLNRPPPKGASSDEEEDAAGAAGRAMNENEKPPSAKMNKNDKKTTTLKRKASNNDDQDQDINDDEEEAKPSAEADPSDADAAHPHDHDGSNVFAQNTGSGASKEGGTGSCTPEYNNTTYGEDHNRDSDGASAGGGAPREKNKNKRAKRSRSRSDSRSPAADADADADLQEEQEEESVRIAPAVSTCSAGNPFAGDAIGSVMMEDFGDEQIGDEEQLEDAAEKMSKNGDDEGGRSPSDDKKKKRPGEDDDRRGGDRRSRAGRRGRRSSRERSGLKAAPAPPPPLSRFETATTPRSHAPLARKPGPPPRGWKQTKNPTPVSFLTDMPLGEQKIRNGMLRLPDVVKNKFYFGSTSLPREHFLHPDGFFLTDLNYRIRDLGKVEYVRTDDYKVEVKATEGILPYVLAQLLERFRLVLS